MILGSQAGDHDAMYETTRRCTLRLVGLRSVSPSKGEARVAREVVRLLHEGGLAGAYAASGLDPLPADPHGRQNAYALLRGQSPLTVVLLGHLDTLGTADYGALEPWALDPEALATHGAGLAASLPMLAADLAARPDDWTLGDLEGPAVVIFYAPPYYPHVASSCGPLQQAAASVVAAHADLNLVLRAYFPLLSDMSYLRLDPALDLTALRANMPIWQDPETPARPGSYGLPLAAMRALDLPAINIGPYGRDVHQRGERVLMSYSFGVVPRLIEEIIERLAGLLTPEHGQG